MGRLFCGHLLKSNFGKFFLRENYGQIIMAKRVMIRIKVILLIKTMKKSVLWMSLTESSISYTSGTILIIVAKLKHILKLKF